MAQPVASHNKVHTGPIAVADGDVSALTGRPTGEIPSAFSFSVNILGVAHGIHSVVLGNVTAREGQTSTNVSQRLLILLSGRANNDLEGDQSILVSNWIQEQPDDIPENGKLLVNAFTSIS
ncbi:MAG: hypothetical protein Q9169_007239 [Polycauliona sp. 2 TL-2023]